MGHDFHDLIERARRGDSGAVEVLLGTNLPGLRAYIRLRSGRLLRAKESVSDLVQSVCREVLQDLPRFPVESEQAFRHWLYTSAHRKILDRKKYWEADKRDAAREQSLDAADGEREGSLLARYGSFFTPSHHAAVREEVARLEEAFEKLPPDQREVITLSRLVGLSHAEIAQRMERTEDSVRQLLSRGLARLARLLNPGAPPA